MRLKTRPDRVVGLYNTNRFQAMINSCSPNLKHSPVEGRRQLIYPFIVLEAKRERDAPGFRAVEEQTAFFVRRFLKLQDDLRIARGGNIDPLVWFFASQGEEWRLYGGILEDDRVVIFYLFYAARRCIYQR